MEIEIKNHEKNMKRFTNAIKNKNIKKIKPTDNYSNLNKTKE